MLTCRAPPPPAKLMSSLTLRIVHGSAVFHWKSTTLSLQAATSTGSCFRVMGQDQIRSWVQVSQVYDVSHYENFEFNIWNRTSRGVRSSEKGDIGDSAVQQEVDVKEKPLVSAILCRNKRLQSRLLDFTPLARCISDLPTYSPPKRPVSKFSSVR